MILLVVVPYFALATIVFFLQAGLQLTGREPADHVSATAGRGETRDCDRLRGPGCPV